LSAAHAAASAEPIREILAAESHPDIRTADWNQWRSSVSRLYAEHGFAPAWFADRSLTRSAVALVHELQDAARRGLDSADYRVARFEAAAARGIPGTRVDADEIPLLDVALSVAAARFVAELHAGRVDPQALGFRLDVSRPPFDAIETLRSLTVSPGASASASVLDSVEPNWRRFALLKRALAQYRALAAEPAPAAIPAPPKWGLSVGEAYADAPALRRLLRAFGDLHAAASDAAPAKERLDADLVAALRRFQTRNGLRSTGALDEETYRALSVPLDVRVRQIELTLERFRWLPPKLESPPIIVNIPQFRLFALYTIEDREDAILPIDVIVGREFARYNTPVFAADMQYVVFQPYWDVPDSILVSELLPQIEANPGWIRSKGYEVVWTAGGRAATQEVTGETISALSSGRARLRQRPGPENALGRVKFVMPNRYSVYLHDTPTAALFAAPRRALSHGCIRVADPVALAEYVLRANPGWTRERIVAAMQADATLRVDLARPIRVFIVYATTLVAEDGTVYFFEDLYGHDARLEAALRSRRQ